jgi:hypothetical protein
LTGLCKSHQEADKKKHPVALGEAECARQKAICADADEEDRFSSVLVAEMRPDMDREE